MEPGYYAQRNTVNDEWIIKQRDITEADSDEYYDDDYDDDSDNDSDKNN